MAVLAGYSGMALAQSATIEGTITESAGGTPIGGATVAISSPGGVQHDLLATGTTNASGQYSISIPVATGETRPVTVEAAGPEHAPARYGYSLTLRCFFGCGWGGEIDVDEGTTVSEIDIALDAGGRISGMITDAATGDPLADATATLVAFDAQNNSVADYSPDFGGIAQPDGSYTSGLAVAADTYYLRGGHGDNGANYVSQAWGGFPCELAECPIVNSDPVTVTAGAVAAGFDFALQPGATLSGELLPEDIDKMVYLFNGAGRLLEVKLFAWEDPPGSEWSFEGLAGGSYYIQLGPYFASSNHIRVLHNGLLCPWSGCERARGTPLSLPAGSSLSLSPFTLDEGGQIEGTIVNGATGLPPAGVPADARLGQYDIVDADGAVAGGGAIREVDGSIVMQTSTAVPAGDYFVRTHNHFQSDGIGYVSMGSGQAIEGYMDAIFPDVACTGVDCDLAAAEPVSVTVGSVTSIEIQIEIGSSISGRVVDEATGSPMERTIVRVLDAAGNTVARALTDIDGDYLLGAFPAGDYYVRTSMSGHVGPGHVGVQHDYFDTMHGASEHCSESLCNPANGTSVSLDGSADVDLGDFEVSVGPVISGLIINVETGFPITRGQVEVYTDIGKFVGSYKLDSVQARYQTTALPPGDYKLVPRVSPVFSDVSTGGTSTTLRGQTPTRDGITVTMGEESVEANLQVIDQAIDRLFNDAFSGAE
ncbi:carboxypeptidase regulatory-like domain-containing protein [Wenzhouxiangella sp. EGI_FJ10305]|uniref:carboxypeptidase regulatory-like domain-containing protein n=1 Tax=Wenzhouxiangella sp. EGI_FJ10305 TaxID=3243768 RepID=UPI0035E29320